MYLCLYFYSVLSKAKTCDKFLCVLLRFVSEIAVQQCCKSQQLF
jgi:hypothetical protein